MVSLQDYDAMLADLSLQQRADRRRRQQVVANLPVSQSLLPLGVPLFFCDVDFFSLYCDHFPTAFFFKSSCLV